MPILNYTTSISPDRSVGQISKVLSAHGASRIMVEYGPDRQPSGLAFTITTMHGDRPFRLPANIEGVERTLQKQRSRNSSRRRKVTPQRAMREHATRVAWRILFNWVEVQMALVEAGLVTVDEVMLPYLLLDGKRTVYQMLSDRQLQLEAPR
jgi:hypothetical protein